MFFGLVLIAIGIIALLIKLGVLAGSIWSYVWPIILIILGLVFIFGRGHRRGFWRGCCWRREDEEKK